MSVSLAGRVTSVVHSHFVFGRRVRILGSHIAQMIPDDVGSMLDLGCGDGTLARDVASQHPGLAVHGLEIRARPVTAIPVTVYAGDVLPFDNDSYDVVLLVDMLHHAENPTELLREAARVARTSVIVKDHLADPWWGSSRLAAMDWVGNIGHGVPLRDVYWTRQQWEAGFRQAGLHEVERREQLELYPSPVRWLFETGLHFISRLSSKERQA